MGVYVHKLSAQTIEAKDLRPEASPGDTVKIAFAPYWMKAFSDFYNCLQAIQDNKHKYESPWMYGGANKIREDERRAAFWGSPSAWEKRMLTYMKRGLSASERAEKKLEEEGVTILCFYDKKSLDKYGYSVAYEITGGIYFDTPDYGTPEVGIVVNIKSGYKLVPYSKMLLDSFEVRDILREAVNQQ